MKCRGQRNKLPVILGLASILAAVLNLCSFGYIPTHSSNVLAIPKAVNEICPPPHRDAISFVPNGTCTFYSEFKSGGSGYVVKNMLYAHACATYWGFRYGGACINNKIASRDVNFTNTVEQLIQEMGWGSQLRFACPQDKTDWMMNMKLPQFQMQKCQTREWKETMQNRIQHPQTPTNYTIAIHIRRGDVTPCTKEVQFRYVPNQYYLNLLDYYDRPGAIVKIFSEMYTFEPFDVFRDRGYQLILSGPLEAAWRAFVEADLFIMSESSFSFIPGIMSRHRVVYAMDQPWQYVNMPLTKHWETPGEAIQAQLAPLRAEISKNTAEFQKKCSAYRYPGH